MMGDDEAPEGFLLDTNVISEIRKEIPDKHVMEWMDVWDVNQTYMSVVTICEIRKGIHKMPEGKRRNSLNSWLNIDVADMFSGRILPVDTQTAECWGKLIAEHGHYDVMDMLVAATALVHNLTIATRNVKHFKIRGLRVMNPWLESGA